MLQLEKMNPHSRDEHIVFVEEGHKYYIDGDDNYLSGTTIIHKLFPTFDPDKVIDKIKEKNTNEKYMDLTKDEIKELWKTKGEEASRMGTQTHLNIELYSNGEVINDDSIEFKQFLQFRQDYPYLEPYRTEWTIYDRKLRIAGSIDMVYKDTRDNSYHIYDWKRSNGFKRDINDFTEMGYKPINHIPNLNTYLYFLQLNLYKYILERNYNIKIKSIYLCRLYPDSDSYELVKGDDFIPEIKKILKLRREQVKDGIYSFQIDQTIYKYSDLNSQCLI